MKTLIVIPARYASSRFPAKPLAQIAGPDGVKTLVQRAWEAGLAAGQMIGAQVATARLWVGEKPLFSAGVDSGLT